MERSDDSARFVGARGGGKTRAMMREAQLEQARGGVVAFEQHGRIDSRTGAVVEGELVCHFEDPELYVDTVATQRAMILTAMAYEFEAEWIHPMDDGDDSRLTRPQCRELAREAAARYGLPAPRVRFVRSPMADAQGGLSGIWLPRWAQKPALVLHETAHYIAETWCFRLGEPSAGHGARWLGVYLDLIEYRYDIMADLLASVAVTSFGLEYERPKTRELPPAPPPVQKQRGLVRFVVETVSGTTPKEGCPKIASGRRARRFNTTTEGRNQCSSL